MKFTTIGHCGMDICNPLGERSIKDAFEVLEQWLPSESPRVIDIGCGKGELLLRLAERRGAIACGVDINPSFLAEARQKAEARGCTLKLLNQTFAEFMAARDPGDQGFDAVLCIGASHAVGSPREAPALMAKLLRPGGLLLLGEGFWRREPDPEYLAVLGATRDDFTDHAGNHSLGAAAGLTCIHAAEAAAEDFERYEKNYGQAIDDYIASHPDDPDDQVMARRIADWRAAFERWGRATLGFGLYLFAAS